MFLDRYFAGTISVSANGTAVTGVGTAWVANGVQAGDYLHARGLMIRIGAVVSNTSITLAEGWPGSALSGASYAILYRVDADRYGAGQAQLLNTLASGNLSSLAGLAGTAGRVPYFAGTNAMAETPLTAWGRSLIDDSDVAAFWATIGATSDPAQAFRRGNVVGTVSQSGGVPTGALMEYGSNANGSYLRLADGTQICMIRETMTYSTTATGAIFRDATTAGTWTFPAAFNATPLYAHFSVVGSVAWSACGGITASAMSGRTVFSSIALSGTSIMSTSIAVGRWY